MYPIHPGRRSHSASALVHVGYQQMRTWTNASIKLAREAAVNAIFESPSFLYRTEFGANAQEGPLTPYELASQLSYFVTDGPPDEQLLAAAAGNMLSTPEQIGPHVDRMLSTPAARLNLSR